MLLPPSCLATPRGPSYLTDESAVHKRERFATWALPDPPRAPDTNHVAYANNVFSTLIAPRPVSFLEAGLGLRHPHLESKLQHPTWGVDRDTLKV